MELWIAAAQNIAIIAIVSLVIMKACDAFEQSASYLGRNMGAGARGSLVDAIGSSLPELLVTLMFVASGKPELILAGVAVTAGSAIFNAVLIPALSILAARDEDGNKVESFTLSRKTTLRDGIWLLAVEGVLIWFLGFSSFTMIMGGSLLALYVMYAMHVMYDSSKSEEDSDEYEFESLESTSTFKAILNCDFNKLFFKDKEFTTTTAWAVLGAAVLVIGIACHFLAVGVEGFAVAIGIPVYFSAVVLGAAATSVPDTILSIKSAKRGDYEDAVGNAIGSNIFDVTVSLALPICLYLAVEGGSLPMEQSSDLVMLRWFVLGTSAAVVASLFAQSQKVCKKTAVFLLSLYAVWIGYIVSAM